MKTLLLLAALANPVATTPPVPTAPPSTQDVRKEAPKILPNYIDDRRIQIRPGSTKPNPEGKPGPGVG